MTIGGLADGTAAFVASPGAISDRSIAVTREYGTWRSPLRSVFARYVSTGCASRPALPAACAAADARGGSRSPAATSSAIACWDSIGRSDSPKSSIFVTAASALDSGPSVVADPSAMSSALTRDGCSRSCCRRRSGTKTARTPPCCGRIENSPASDRSRTARTVNRIVRPLSSFCPCSDSIGMADGRSTRTRIVPPPAAPISAASARLTKASRPAGPDRPPTPWNVQKRSSTP